MSGNDRREFLRQAGLAGMFSAVTPAVFAQSGAFTVEEANSKPTAPTRHQIKFAAIGLDHAHIFSMCAALKRGGGELVSFFATDPKQIENFRKQFGDVKLAASEDEIIQDKSIQLVAGAPIPDLRAPLGVRVDWFTPDGLPTWGDGRLTILGTEGYIELRKYIDIAGRPGENHLFIVNKQGPRHVDCSQVERPFGRLFLDDVRNRTETAMPQERCFNAMKLALTAQALAERGTEWAQ